MKALCLIFFYQFIPKSANNLPLVDTLKMGSYLRVDTALHLKQITGQLNHAIQQNAASAEALAANAEEMSSQARQFQQTMFFFRLR